MHEASLYEHNHFVTLTYDPEHLPDHGSLDRTAFPRFMKRLRKHLSGVRYFHCGEYGEDRGRPHYHACLFNCELGELVPWRIRNGFQCYRSPLLERVWKDGASEVGSLTFESASYVAQYVCKKVKLSERSDGRARRKAENLYRRVDPDTGELVEVEPEYGTMSNRPGIGRGWIEKYWKDVYPSDEVIVRGVSSPVPRYYDAYFENVVDAEAAVELRKRRRALRRRQDETPERLQVREVCAEARMNLYPSGGEL